MAAWNLGHRFRAVRRIKLADTWTCPCQYMAHLDNRRDPASDLRSEAAGDERHAPAVISRLALRWRASRPSPSPAPPPARSPVLGIPGPGPFPPRLWPPSIPGRAMIRALAGGARMTIDLATATGTRPRITV